MKARQTVPIVLTKEEMEQDTHSAESDQYAKKSGLVGTVAKLPTKADAIRAIEHRRMEINSENPQQRFHSVTVGGLIDRFMKEYAPKHCRLNTQRDYRYSFNNHVRPRWGTVFIQNVKTMAVQDWLAVIHIPDK